MPLVFLGVGCGSRAPGELSQLQKMGANVATLEFTRTTSAPGPQSQPLQVVLRDRTKVQSLYQDTLSLPEISGVQGVCRNDVGVVYHLNFRSDSGVVLQVDEEPDGCEWVRVTGVDGTLVANDGYWTRLSQGLGVPESIMYPDATN